MDIQRESMAYDKWQAIADQTGRQQMANLAAQLDCAYETVIAAKYYELLKDLDALIDKARDFNVNHQAGF